MPATRKILMDRLDELGIATQTFDHAPVFTVEESRAECGHITGGHCKNLFLKDKKGALWLVVCLEDARVDLKTFNKTIGSARLSFGKPDLLIEVLGVEPGSVTPFALINDTGQRVEVILDARMLAHDIINFHPLENTATTSIRPADLVTFIRACGHQPRTVTLG